MATFDAFDLTEVLPPGPTPEWLLSKPVTDEYVLDVPLWRRQCPDDPRGVQMLMAYPDALAPLLDTNSLLKIWMQHRVTYPNFLKSLPGSRQQELLSTFYNTTVEKTPAHRRGEQPALSEVLAHMSETYKEAFMHLLPVGDTLEARVMLWLMK